MQQHNEELQISSDELKSEGIDSEIEVQDSKLREIVVHGSMDRLNPILMTALTAALALIPLVFQGDKPGNEIQSPMAVVVLGGLLTSTLLNIYIVPVVYEMLEKRKQKKNEKNSN